MILPTFATHGPRRGFPVTRGSDAVSSSRNFFNVSGSSSRPPISGITADKLRISPLPSNSAGRSSWGFPKRSNFILSSSLVHGSQSTSLCVIMRGVSGLTPFGSQSTVYGRLRIGTKKDYQRPGMQRSIGCWALGLLGLCVTTVGLRAQPTSDIQKMLDFERHAQPSARTYQVAYLSQCVNNPYCKTGLEGVKAAARKFGLNIKVFDAQFNPNEQLKDVQNAVAGNFDGYILAPTAAIQACSMYGNYLKPTGKPVVVYDVPMCGDLTATPGIAGTVLMQTQAYFDSIMEAAFASCKGKCEAAVVGGYVGTDLFNFWQSSLAKAQARHLNVKVTV